MEKCIINRKSVKKNTAIKHAQKVSKKYYQDKLFEQTTHEPKAKIQKLVNIRTLDFVGDKPKCKAQETSPSVLEFTHEDLLALCNQNHIYGQSGNGFPTAKKLAAFYGKSGILLINGVECDPGLVHDAWIYRNCIDKIETGVKLLDSIYHFNEIVLATKEPLNSNAYSFKQVKVKNRFPIGYENYLIETLFHKKIPAGQFPTDIGILTLNLQSILAISRMTGNSKYITISNLSDATAKVIEVKPDQHIYDIAKKAYPSLTGTIYAGSGSFQCHKADPDEIVDEKTFYIAIDHMPDYSSAGKCLRCGKCTGACPAGVQVSKIVRYVEKNGRQDNSECSAFHPELCISCGACTYMCSAGKDTREVVAWAKNQL